MGECSCFSRLISSSLCCFLRPLATTSLFRFTGASVIILPFSTFIIRLGTPFQVGEPLTFLPLKPSPPCPRVRSPPVFSLIFLLFLLALLDPQEVLAYLGLVLYIYNSGAPGASACTLPLASASFIGISGTGYNFTHLDTQTFLLLDNKPV